MIRSALTKVWGDGSQFSKTINRNPDGTLTSSVPEMISGRFETLEFEWSQFGTVLDALQPAEALLGGVFKDAKKGEIITRSTEARLLENNGGLRTEPRFSRTLKNITYHQPPCPQYNTIMFDLDSMPAGMSLEDAVFRLIELYPDLGYLESGCWAKPSASSLLYDTETGEQVKGLSGVHIYFAIPNCYQIPELKAYLLQQGWLSGGNYYKLSKDGALLERGFIDYAVFSPERLDFIGGAICGAGSGLDQRRGSAEFFAWEAEADHGSRAGRLFRLSREQRAEADRLKLAAKLELQGEALRVRGEATERLRQQNPNLNDADFRTLFGEGGELPGNFELVFKDAGSVPVWRLIFFPEEYAGQYCADPFAPEKGTQKATFYYNRDNDRASRFIISSFAGGGRQWRLKTDINGVRAMLEDTKTDVIAEKLRVDEHWSFELASLASEAERAEVAEALKNRKIVNKTEMKTKMGEAIAAELAADKYELLAKMNERFAYVTVGAKARYVEDTGTEMVLRAKVDFLSEVEDWPKIKQWGSAGKIKLVSPGEEWLKWEGRRRYPGGLRFEPGVLAKEFPDQNGLVLNRFRGLAVKPREKGQRECGMVGCGGRGCLAWFFAEIKEGLPDDEQKELIKQGQLDQVRLAGVCPDGGWTYWLRTIHDVAAGGVVEHTRWIVDWLMEMVQAPGGRYCPGARKIRDAETGQALGLVDGKRSEVSLCLRGGQGTGKGTIIEPIMAILAPYSAKVTDMTQITSNFNKAMEDLLLLFADEAVWGGNRKEGNKLKDMITGDTLRIEPKGIDAYFARNFIRLYIASNSEWVIPAEEDERRYTIFDVTQVYAKNRAWFGKVKAGDVRDLLTEALSWEIKSDIHQNVETEALRTQKSFGRKPVDAFIEMAVEENWFWDENGIGKKISHEQIRELYERHCYSIHGVAPAAFVKHFRAKLAQCGYQAGSGRVRMGNAVVNGLTMPGLDWFRNQFSFLPDF